MGRAVAAVAVSVDVCMVPRKELEGEVEAK